MTPCPSSSALSVRAVTLGLVAGLGISGVVYLNDWVIGQTLLLGNHLPISIFGGAILLLLGINPLLRRLNRAAPLRGAEVIVAVAIALSCSAWPGSGFYRWLLKQAALPAHWEKTRPHWRSTGVMSYVPGASSTLALGHVTDFRKLVERLRASEAEPRSVEGRLWNALDPATHRIASRAHTLDLDAREGVIRAINVALATPDLLRGADLSRLEPWLAEAAQGSGRLSEHDRVRTHRRVLVKVFSGLILPQPAGGGWLVSEGRADQDVVDPLVQGVGGSRFSLLEVPWRAWLPTLALWGGLGMLFALAMVSLALIVHPQWSKRELLAYPVVRFIEELTAGSDDSPWPNVFKSRLFWAGILTMAFYHGVNGLSSWFTGLPEFPRSLDFNPLRVLFPDAGRFWHASAYFAPALYVTVIAFAFFVPAQVSFSLGISHLLFIMLGAWLVSYGVPFEFGRMTSTNTAMLGFGGYVGAALIIAYTGRRYYGNVFASALGARRHEETPRSATWGARVLMVAASGTVVVMNWAGLSPLMAILFVGFGLLTLLVIARISTETGAFHINAGWQPLAAISGLFGFEAIGPTAFIVLAIASNFFFHDQREALITSVVNGFRMTEARTGIPPTRILPWMAIVVLGGFVVAGLATFYFSYKDGAIARDPWGGMEFPRIPFELLSSELRRAAAEGTLADATRAGSAEHLLQARPDRAALGWAGVGLMLVVATAAARLRFTWWPLHPVAFLVWGTWEIMNFAFSFLLGWLIKVSVMSTAGVRGYHQVKPLMIGLIAGELLMGLFWILVGAVYYLVTGLAPTGYNIFPR